MMDWPDKLRFCLYRKIPPLLESIMKYILEWKKKKKKENSIFI